jgi:hypothetical protein
MEQQGVKRTAVNPVRKRFRTATHIGVWNR